MNTENIGLIEMAKTLGEMNVNGKCKNCGEETPEKFCSYSCFLRYREKFPEDMDL